MTLHLAEQLSLEVLSGWQVSPTLRLWVEDIIAAFGLMLFIGSAWILTAVVQVALPV